jgi:hypothetical protein
LAITISQLASEGFTVVTGGLVKMTAMSNGDLRDLEERVEASEKSTRNDLA